MTDLVRSFHEPERQPAPVLKAALRTGTSRFALGRSMISLRKAELVADRKLRLTA